ncbi:MAG: hypothetical protein RSC92_03800, partial [Clostridia bacterium]
MESTRDFNIKNINNDINNDINKNRIWIVDNNNLNIYNNIKDIDNIKIIKDKQEIKMPYKDHTFILSLIEKK